MNAINIKPKISIILFAQDNYDYLENCISNILNQTLKDFEIILVFDELNNKDRDKILKKYCLKDNRIKIAGNEININGQYVLITEPSFNFEKNFFDKAFNTALKNNADIVLSGVTTENTDSNTSIDDKYYLKKQFLKEEIVNDISTANIFEITAPVFENKLFSRDFLMQQNKKYSYSVKTENIFFILMCLFNSETTLCINENLILRKISNKTHLQHSEKQNPLNLLDSYSRAYYEIKNKLGVVSEKSFINSFLEFFRKNIKLNCGFNMRVEISKTLSESKFVNRILNLNKEYFSNYDNYLFLKGLTYSCKTRKRIYSNQKSACPKVSVKCTAQNPLVSVVIPVYNVEKYLRECLDSLVFQTLENIEIICVDDGSTDSSFNILLEYAAKDNRFTIIRQNNSRQSTARNIGVNYANGKYIYFMDSDDFLEKETLEELYRKSENEDLDILFFCSQAFIDEENKENINFDSFNHDYKKIHTYSGVYRGQDLFTRMDYNNEYRVGVVIEFIKRDFYLNSGLKFEEGIIHEDYAFAYMAMIKARRVSHIKKPYYNRRVRANSTMTSDLTFENSYGYFKCFKNMEAVLATSEISDENKLTAVDMINRALTQSINIYMNLNTDEKCRIFALNEQEQLEFINLVQKFADIKTKNDNLNKKLSKNERDFNNKIKKLNSEISEKNKILNKPLIKTAVKISAILSKIKRKIIK
ncbi:MAG: glycosyltransferase [Clostridiales bacterium]|nr:glycosyltransferase [Clostridiales bacterium]